MIDIRTRREILTLATSLAVDAGKITLDYFLEEPKVEFKSDQTPVTIADREVEEYIRTGITTNYPNHGILGEEYGERETDSDFKWIIDPIDGTKSFVLGVPLYTVLVSVLYKSEPLIGVIHNPPSGETVSASSGVGCFHNGKQCRVGTVQRISDAQVHVTDYADLKKYRPEFTDRLISSAKSCRTWGDAYGYLLVATGRADVMIDPIMNIWDIAPLKPIITEAGGIFLDLDGNDTGLGDSALACNPYLHREIIELLQ